MFRPNNPHYMWTSLNPPKYQKLKPVPLKIPHSTPSITTDDYDSFQIRPKPTTVLNLSAQGTYRERLRFYMDRSFVGRWWDILDSFVNLVFVGWYIYLTTFSLGPRNETHPHPPPLVLINVDTLLAALLFLIWIPRVYLSFDPMRSLLFEFYSHLSLLSTFTVFFAHAVRDHNDFSSLLQAGDLIFLYPFRFWRLHLSLMNNLHPSDKNLIINLQPVSRKAVELGLSIFSTLFIVTAWVHICLYRVQKYYDLSFFDVFYTISVSSTSGLATQIIPDNIFSRIITLYVMIVGAIFIPKNLSDLLTLIRSQSSYLSPFKTSPGCGHIVIIGTFQLASLRSFLLEFFCIDHGPITMKTKVVLLSDQDPDEDIEAFLKGPFYVHRVTYVKANPLSFVSMSKAKLESALACFLFSEYSEGLDCVQEDSVLVMQALALRKYSKSLPIYAHVLQSETRFHLKSIATQVICVEEIKNAVVAQNLLSPGFSTLLYLLTTSMPNKAIQDIRSRKQSSKETWIHDYTDGMKNEIYSSPLSDSFIGYEFADASHRIFEKHNAVFFAIGVVNLNTQVPQILLNPLAYVFQGGEMGYFITHHAEEAYKIAQFGPYGSPQDERVYVEDELQSRDSDPIPVSNKQINHQSQDELIIITESQESFSKDTSVHANVHANAITNVKQKMKKNYLSDHIVVCNLGSCFPKTIASFLGPLRATEPSIHVVILSESEPSLEQKQEIESFGNVVYIQGSSLNRKDLQSACIEDAWKAVILGKHQQSKNRADDSGALLSVLNIQSLCSHRSSEKKIFIMVEFVFVENMKYLGRDELSYSTDLLAQLIIPTFVSGQVFCKSIFHSTLCQAFYNPNLMDVIRQIVYNGWQLTSDSHIAFDSKESPYGHIQQEAVPKECQGDTYSKLYKYMLNNGKLCIGLYRHEQVNSKNIWYVLVNPSLRTIVKPDDLIFLFGKSKLT